MAGVAGEPARMLGSHHLGKPLRLSAVGLMTSSADDRRVELRRLNTGILSMIRQRSVTGFAGDHHVLTGLLLVGNIGVTGLAGLVAGVDDRLGRDLSDGRPAKVSILAKTLRDYGCAQNHKRHQGDQHHRREPD